MDHATPRTEAVMKAIAKLFTDGETAKVELHVVDGGARDMFINYKIF